MTIAVDLGRKAKKQKQSKVVPDDNSLRAHGDYLPVLDDR